MMTYFSPSSSCQSELELAVVRTGLELPSEAQCPSASDIFRSRCANKDFGLVDDARFYGFLNRNHAFIVKVRVPRSGPTTFSTFSEEIIVKERHGHVRFIR